MTFPTLLPRKALALALGIVLAALAASSASAASVRSFRPVAVRDGALFFRVRAIAPERVTRVRLVLGERFYPVSTSVVRAALRRRGVVRARIVEATIARAGKRAARRKAARLQVYLKPASGGGTSRPAPAGDSAPAAPAATTGSPARPAAPAPAPTGTKTTRTTLNTAPCDAQFGTFASPTNIPGACWRPYADSSPFNQPLPANPRLDQHSTEMAATMVGWGKPMDPYVGAADTTSDWSHPIYFSSPADPVFTVHCTKSWGTCEVEGMQVRIPDAARAAGGGDGHMAVIDQQNGWEYDFWQVQSKPQGGGQLVISWGGRTAIGTPDADGLGSDATAANFGLAAGVVRLPELQAGQINHALFMMIKCDGGGHVYPAMGNGSACGSGTIAPKEGARVFLDMTDDQIAALGLPTWKAAIITALAHYGAFVGDTGGSPWEIELESASTYTSFGMPDPWVDFAKQQPGVTEWRSKYVLPFADGIDWGRYLKVADPCVTQRTC